MKKVISIGDIKQIKYPRQINPICSAEFEREKAISSLRMNLKTFKSNDDILKLDRILELSRLFNLSPSLVRSEYASIKYELQEWGQ